MKKTFLVIIGSLLLGSLVGCVGPSYHNGVYGGSYSPYYGYDSAYLYDYPYPGYHSSLYFGHSYHRHSVITHKRPPARFDHQRHVGKHYFDRSSRHSHSVGSHDHRSPRHLQPGHKERILKDDKPAFQWRTFTNERHRVNSGDQQLRERGLTRESSPQRDRTGKQFERADRQNNNSSRGSVKCFGQHC